VKTLPNENLATFTIFFSSLLCEFICSYVQLTINHLLLYQQLVAKQNLLKFNSNERYKPQLTITERSLCRIFASLLYKNY